MGTAVATLGDRTADVIAVNWDQEMRGAKALLESGLCPAGIKSPQAALFIILTGRDLGLSPVQSLRSIHVIQGKIEVAADQQLALFKRAGGRAEFKVLTDTEATLALKHANGDKHTETFTIEDAKRAGLVDGNWKKYPKAMLRSRAITAGLKSIGFDATAGLYAPGEVTDAEITVTETNAVENASQATAATTEQGEGPTEKQVALFEKMLKSHLFDGDRAEWQEKAVGITKREMGDLIDMVMQQGKARRAAEQDAERLDDERDAREAASGAGAA